MQKEYFLRPKPYHIPNARAQCFVNGASCIKKIVHQNPHEQFHGIKAVLKTTERKKQKRTQQKTYPCPSIVLSVESTCIRKTMNKWVQQVSLLYLTLAIHFKEWIITPQGQLPSPRSRINLSNYLGWELALVSVSRNSCERRKLKPSSLTLKNITNFEARIG